MPKPESIFCALQLFLLLTQSATSSIDVAAVAAFKAAIKPASIPPTSCLASWNFSGADPCAVPRIAYFTCGITCSGGRVVQITLDSQGYAGTLTPLISKLTELIALDLGGNGFTGQIPASIASLANLKTLIISGNSFSGPVPPSIAALHSLETLDLSRNSLSGPLPDLHSLAGLTQLDLSFNRLTGSVPRLPPNLNELALKANSLSGSLTESSFAGLNRLMVVELSENSFTGTLNPWLFLLPSLQQIDLAKNAFTGVTVDKPASSDGGDLVAVNLSYNKIVGPLPANFAEYPMLRSLAVSYNKFQGPIPWQYSKKGSPLRQLYLDGNYLTGHPPAGLFDGNEAVSGSLGDNCLQNCPISSELCSKPQKPASICEQAYRRKPNS